MLNTVNRIIMSLLTSGMNFHFRHTQGWAIESSDDDGVVAEIDIHAYYCIHTHEELEEFHLV